MAGSESTEDFVHIPPKCSCCWCVDLYDAPELSSGVCRRCMRLCSRLEGCYMRLNVRRCRLCGGPRLVLDMHDMAVKRPGLWSSRRYRWTCAGLCRLNI